MTLDLRYTQRFAVRVTHGYTGKADCGMVAVEPTDHCGERLRRRHCRLRPRTGGIEIWQGGRSDAPVAAGVDLLPATFLVRAMTADFGVCTPLGGGDAGAAGSCLYYAMAGAQGASATVADGTVLAVRRRKQIASIAPAAPGAEITLVRPGTSRVLWRSPVPPHSPAAAAVALGAVADGRYLLRRDGGEVLDFFLTDQPASGLIAVVDVLPDAAAPAIAADPASYRLHFPARKTRWRYVIQSHGDALDLSGATVTGMPAEIEFNRPTKIRLRGRPAWSVESKTAIPLTLSLGTDCKFMLAIPPRGSRPHDPVALRAASLGDTRPERNGAEVEWWSSIHVYL